MNNIKRISLMTAIFLTVALVSSAVEAGVIRINGTIAGSESYAPFPDPAEGLYVNGSVTSTDTQLHPRPMRECRDRRDQRYHQRHHRRKGTGSVGRPRRNRRRA